MNMSATATGLMSGTGAVTRLERHLVRALLRLPERTLRRLARPPAGADTPMDPHIQLVLALRRLRGYGGMTLRTPERTRAFMRQQTALARAVPTPVREVRDLVIADGAEPLAARYYAPEHAAGRPLLVYLHGGGFVACDLETHDEPCRLLCRHGKMHVLSVAYRLAPENPFPAAVEDAAHAYAWAVRHVADLGADLGADRTRVAIGGDSAGANLATVVCRLAADGQLPSGIPAPAAQLLLYPPTKHDPNWPSRQAYADGFLLTGTDIEFSFRHYAPEFQPDDFRHSPMTAAGLRKQAPAVIVTAAFDPLRDEGEAYAEALRDAGTRVESWRIPGLVHGFVNLTTLSPAAYAAVVDIARRLARILEET